MGWPLQRLAQCAADLADDEGATHSALAELLEQPLVKAVSCLRVPNSLIRPGWYAVLALVPNS
ncbi:hypothetical protein IWQ60_012101, partial [Tieghemiomyces parasiticus]